MYPFSDYSDRVQTFRREADEFRMAREYRRRRRAERHADPRR